MLQPLSRSTLTHQAIEAIKQLILRDNLASGAQLPSERELSEALVVSRNIVREALSVLDAEGVITRKGGKGTFVAHLDRPATLDTAPVLLKPEGHPNQVSRDARYVLEMGALELIVRRITDAEIVSLSRIVDSQERLVRAGKQAIKEDIDFHVALLQATDNPILIDMAPLVINGLREGFLQAPQGLYRSVDSDFLAHRTIIEALKRRDLDQARAAMRAHFIFTDFPDTLIQLPESE